jgi:hypothetical protein
MKKMKLLFTGLVLGMGAVSANCANEELISRYYQAQFIKERLEKGKISYDDEYLATLYPAVSKCRARAVDGIKFCGTNAARISLRAMASLVSLGTGGTRISGFNMEKSAGAQNSVSYYAKCSYDFRY